MHTNVYKRAIASVMLCTLVLFGVSAIADDDKPFAEKKIVLQISDGDPSKQDLILNVTNNVLREYGADKVQIEIVAFGPGLRLLFADNANKDRIQSLSTTGVKFTACSNTITNMSKILGHPLKVNPLATTESPGIVRIVKLVTEDGYTLVKP